VRWAGLTGGSSNLPLRLCTMRARRGPPFELKELCRHPDASSPGTAAEATDSAHSGRAPSHLSGGLAAALTARLDPHHPVAEIALHRSIELDDRAVGSATVPTVPVPDDVFHLTLAFSPKAGDGRVPYWRAGAVGGIGRTSLPRGGRSEPKSLAG
jgi:hypothetical protein